MLLLPISNVSVVNFVAINNRTKPTAFSRYCKSATACDRTP